MFDKGKKTSTAEQEVKERTELYEQIGRLKMESEWLKKIGCFELTERRALIERDDSDLSLRRQCYLLGISRAGLYYEPKGPREDELRLMGAIDRQYMKTPFYGRRRMTVIMQ